MNNLPNPRFRSRWAAISCVLLSSLASHAAFAAEPLKLSSGDTVVFLGGEFIEQMKAHGELEAALTLHWPDQMIKFRNLGWAGDTPAAASRGYFEGAAEGYARLTAELKRLQPRVTFVCYGSELASNDAAALATFRSDLEKLVGDLQAIGSDVVLMTPPPAESKPSPRASVTSLNEARQAAAQAIQALGQARKLRVVDLYSALQKSSNTSSPLTHDGLRYTPAGYLAAAKATAEQLGLPWRELPAEKHAQLQELLWLKNDLYFHRYRPQNETYLRGFRKHEQGRNAKEIEEFDPLIERAEQRIAAMVQGKPLPEALGAKPAPEPKTVADSPEAERKTFKLADGLEISLFAAEPMIPNPIHMNFDSRGRLWVVSSPIYPQIRPGAVPSDQVIILEDTDGDGKADKCTIFADGLLVPTAVLPDERGGAYVANSTEMVHLHDTDGDGKSDKREVILAGFGTEDTHHILHTFRWGVDAAMYFNQSIYIHSHVETPQGVVRLMGSGIWRWRPEVGTAEVVSRGLTNPWGHIFDYWGQTFATDGAGGEGINYAFPGSAFVSAVGYKQVMRGMNPGQPKLCGLEVLTGRHWPQDWQNTLLTADFRANRIVRFNLQPQGSGYVSKQQPDVLTSTSRAFRPVDLKMGPDGALYVADWYDQIINHGEVDFRDPRRDSLHGRIWRITAKGQALSPKPDFANASVGQLLDMLLLPEHWTRQMAKVQLKLRPRDEAVAGVRTWLSKLDPKAAGYEHARLEGLWAMQALLQVEPGLQRAVLASPESGARAAAVRVMREWHSQVPDAAALLERAVGDPHPQVRLEAVNALRELKTVKAAELALLALEQDMDSNLDFALRQTLKALEPVWVPAFESGQLKFADLRKTTFALSCTDSPRTLGPLADMLRKGEIQGNDRKWVYSHLGDNAGPEPLAIVLELALTNKADQSAALACLLQAAKRGVRPKGDLEKIAAMLGTPEGVQLAGYWRVASLKGKVTELAGNAKAPASMLNAAMTSLAAYPDHAALKAFAGADQALEVRHPAIAALARVNPAEAAPLAVSLLQHPALTEPAALSLFDSFFAQREGPVRFEEALKGKTVTPTSAQALLKRARQFSARFKNLIALLETSATAAGPSTPATSVVPAKVLALAAKSGDARRGELLFHRADLACMTCHAVAGGGGRVGPDLVSLGASAPVDYILESLLEPSAKIKEGYHMVIATAKDGEVTQGILLRDAGNQIVLLNAANQEVTLRKDQIAERVIAPTSLMPSGLVASLSESELADLVRFLSSLGKEAPFKAPPQRYVRKWTQPDGTALYSLVPGDIPAASGAKLTFSIDVQAAGTVQLKLSTTHGIKLLRDGKALPLDNGVASLKLPAGVHRFDLHLGDAKKPVRVEVIDGSGHAEPVNN